MTLVSLLFTIKNYMTICCGVINFLRRWLHKLFARKVFVAPEDKTKAQDPAWLKQALLEVGVKEILGQEHNSRILEYHKATSLKATADEISWCSSFMCWCFERTGVTSPRNAAARSWAKWGVGMTVPQRGCVAVFWRVSPTNWRGHVGLYIREDEKHIYVLGGNQSDEVNIAKYPKSKLIAYRWPKQLYALD